MAPSPTPNELTDREFIERPELWPAWPWLPMKRTVEGQLEAGFFLATSISGNAVEFWTGNMYDRAPLAKQKTDLTVAQVLESGWVVD